SLICKHLKASETVCNKIPGVYHNAIIFQKYYTLLQSQSPSKPVQSSALTSLLSKYDYKTVWKTLLDVLKENNLKPGEDEPDKNIIIPKYMCNEEERSFVIKVCSIKNFKLSNCDEIAKDAPADIREAPVASGTVIWIEKSKGNTLIVTDDKSEDQEILFCNGKNKKKFDILDKLSMSLIKKEKSKGK
ncbi:MAG: hypothetical protein JXA66_07915, partial [Oligoflexia bacterium]|nr:hypothetical protein [Oligoflexia bacterium]